MESDLYIGLMSGTSMDGIDAALVDFSQREHTVTGFNFTPWPAKAAQDLKQISVPGQNEIDRLGTLDSIVADAFATSAIELLKKYAVHPSRVRAIGSHGQTIRHRPNFSNPFTLQIGDPNRIAEQTGICVVSDFRRRDMAAGGQGAPLVPTYHAARFFNPEESRVILNIGGIANITLLPADPDAPILGFDTGPGNTLINAWIYQNLNVDLDRSGQWAAGGKVDQELLDVMKSDSYFDDPVPKSTGPEYFSRSWLDEHLKKTNLSPQSIQATLTAFTAETIAEAIALYAPDCSRVIVCGGGVHNNAMMEHLKHRLGNIPLETTREHGIDPEQVESIAFAWLARQTLNGCCGNLPTVTGARHPVILGGIYPANCASEPNNQPQ
ncbi:MAG: anhydro-N-acetylmuramic acid kinase [Gammaproteobacteria bacterium]|nr:anhydro-N-acetylmuramic acid kinase [Gammaproteobacteria bacterium]